ncbi:MAG: hypothetical protein V2I74_09115, partial [Erythrobacter sp.]|nr:hypothetical protein [Erythrobacter sp.]
MHVHPDIAGLRRKGASQPSLDAALARWRALPATAELLQALAAYGAGAALESRPVLARLLQECGAAACLAAGFIDGLVEALRAEPLAQLPLGHATTPGLARIVIAQSGRAALRLAAFAPRDAAPAEAVLFEDGEAHEIVLAGTGQAALYRLAAGRLTGESLVCGPGTRMARQGAHEARQIVAVSRPLL